MSEHVRLVQRLSGRAERLRKMDTPLLIEEAADNIIMLEQEKQELLDLIERWVVIADDLIIGDVHSPQKERQVLGDSLNILYKHGRENEE